MRKGKFIVLYGIAASGKTTQLTLLKDWLENKGYNVISTKEPSKGPIGKLIKGIVRREVDVSRKSLVYLFIADRMDHQEKVIIPALEKGKIVLCERYYVDTLVYQSLEGYPLNFLRTINKYVIKPDISIYIDVPPEVSVNRMRKIGEIPKIYETYEILKKIREKYLKIINYLNKRRLDRIYVVDGNRDVQEVFNSIKLILERKLNL